MTGTSSWTAQRRLDKWIGRIQTLSEDGGLDSKRAGVAGQVKWCGKLPLGSKAEDG